MENSTRFLVFGRKRDGGNGFLVDGVGKGVGVDDNCKCVEILETFCACLMGLHGGHVLVNLRLPVHYQQQLNLSVPPQKFQ